MLNEIYREAEGHMKKSIEALVQRLATIRTGRASTQMFEDLEVEAYGSPQPLKQLATLSTPDAKTVLIQPWDKSLLGAVEKAILAANLGVTPNNDGRIIRINIPPLTEERRREYVKLARHMAEEGRVAVRNIRRHANEEIKKTEKKHEISEDDRHKAMERIQELTDKYIKEIDSIAEKKEAEIMEV